MGTKRQSPTPQIGPDGREGRRINQIAWIVLIRAQRRKDDPTAESYVARLVHLYQSCTVAYSTGQGGGGEPVAEISNRTRARYDCSVLCVVKFM